MHSYAGYAAARPGFVRHTLRVRGRIPFAGRAFDARAQLVVDPH